MKVSGLYVNKLTVILTISFYTSTATTMLLTAVFAAGDRGFHENAVTTL